MNGIGASLEVLQPFVDALDPRRTVIRFDVPGVGGSPRPVVPYNLATFSPVVAGMLDRLGLRRPGRRPRAVLGRRAGPALRRPAPAPGAPAGAGRHRHRLADGAGPPAGAGPDADPAAAPRPGVRPADRRRDLRRHDAHRPRARGPGAARGDPARPAARLLLPAGREHRLEQPAVPAADPAAHAGRRRRRRPDHPGGERADHGAAASPTRGCTSTPAATSR